MAKIDVVISGGSVEGLCTATGFLKAVTVDLGHEIVAAAGNSAGGLVLGCYASGLSAREIETIILDTDFHRFVSVPKWWNIIGIVKAFRNGWLSDGTEFKKFLSRVTREKTFRESRIDLHLAGSNFSRYTLADFNPATDPDMPLATAMRITSCLPGGFKPVEYHGDMWYDGGVRRHYPVDLVPYSDRLFYGWLVGALTPGVSQPVPLRKGVLGVLADFIDQSVDNNVQDSIHISARDPVTVAYDDAYVGTFDFAMARSEKERLIELARQKTLQKLKEVA